MPSRLFYFHDVYEFKSVLTRLYFKSPREADEIIAKYWKGPGWYYHRGHDYWCKYSSERDRLKGGKIGRGPWRHTHDAPSLAAYKLSKIVRRTALGTIEKLDKWLPKEERVVAKTPVSETTLSTIVYSKALSETPPEVQELADYLWENIPERYKDRWTYISVLALAKQIYKYAEEKGIDIKAIDVLHEIDWSLTYNEALEQVKKWIGSSISEYYDIPYSKLERDIDEMLKYYESSLQALEEYA